jgi:carbonic anhydrase
MKSEEALKRLIDGNLRYAAGTPRQTNVTSALRTDLFKNGQHPYAAIIGCSDSRVPVETVFDAGPGEIFVIRTAGNVAGPLEMGSLEYAVLHLKTPLVVVLGHQHCGAVRAAVDGGSHSPAIQSLLEEIIPSVPSAAADPYETCENENIRRTLSKIADDPCIAKAVSEGTVLLAAAKYSLETGIVSIFE